MKLDTHPIFFICYIKEQGRYTVFEYQHKVTALSLDFILIKSMSCFFLGSFKNQAFKFFFQKWQFNSVQSQSLVQKMSRKVCLFQNWIQEAFEIDGQCYATGLRFCVMCILSCASPSFAFRYSFFLSTIRCRFFDMYFKFLVECIFRFFLVNACPFDIISKKKDLVSNPKHWHLKKNQGHRGQNSINFHITTSWIRGIFSIILRVVGAQGLSSLVLSLGFCVYFNESKSYEYHIPVLLCLGSNTCNHFILFAIDRKIS